MSTMTQTVCVFPSSVLFNNYDSIGIEADHSSQQNWDARSGSNMKFDNFCRLVLQKGEYPRLQVVERDNRLYTINNTRLALFQRLEEAGYCSKVKVELVPWKNIPPSLRDILCPPGHVTSLKSVSSRGKRSKGYRLLETSGPFAAPAQVGTADDWEQDGRASEELKEEVYAASVDCSHFYADDEDEEEDDDEEEEDDLSTSDEDYYYGEGGEFESDEDTAM